MEKAVSSWSRKELDDIYAGIEYAVTVPVNIEIRGQQRVLDLGRIERILDEATVIALSECGCRKIRKNCDAPLDVCISIDSSAEESLRSGGFQAKRVSLDEALDALRRSNEAGLVHMAYVLEGREKPEIICSCCSCCCHTLSGLIKLGIAKHVLASELVSETMQEACTNCGLCANPCHFHARMMQNGVLRYDRSNCFGCGICVTRCPEGAIRLVDRPR